MVFVRLSVPVEAGAPGGRTNAYLVDGLLVDPAGRTDDLDAAVAEHRVEHIAVTHPHPDHVAAVERYATTTDATTWARAGYEDRFEAATGLEPDRTFGEGSAVGPATAIETPGHAPDHVAFALGGVAIVGDLAVADGSVFVGGTDGDVRSYLVSLRRLLTRDFETLYPAHGSRIDDPEGTLTRLIEHRLDRESRIQAAVRSGARTLDDIVDLAYEKDLAGVRDLAELAVEAHLAKLAVEGAIEWDGEQATSDPSA